MSGTQNPKDLLDEQVTAYHQWLNGSPKRRMPFSKWLVYQADNYLSYDAKRLKRAIRLMGKDAL
jgi:hypothetical protein